MNWGKIVCFIEEDDEIPEDFSGFIVLDGDDSEAEIDDAEDKLVSTYNWLSQLLHTDYTVLYSGRCTQLHTIHFLCAV